MIECYPRLDLEKKSIIIYENILLFRIDKLKECKLRYTYVCFNNITT